jgi:hypothetical protein
MKSASQDFFRCHVWPSGNEQRISFVILMEGNFRSECHLSGVDSVSGRGKDGPVELRSMDGKY